MQLFKVKGNYKSGFAGETNVTGDIKNNNNGEFVEHNIKEEHMICKNDNIPVIG